MVRRVAMTKPRLLVIGSGFGGLAAAVRQLARGYDVTVLEKLSTPGGRARTFRRDGFTFDAGPTVVTAPQLLHELWSLAGAELSDTIQLDPVEPLYAVRFHDGETFHFCSDARQMEEQVRRLAPEDLEGYRAYLKLSHAIFDVGFKRLSTLPFDSWSSMARVAPRMIRLKSYRTVYGLISKYVKNERLRQILSFHTLLVGGNPFTTTSIYCLISYLEQRWGVSYPRGGIGTLIDGLVGLIDRQGGQVRCNAEVAEILVKGRHATGVRLRDGEIIEADVVIANSDPAWTYRHLMPAAVRRKWTDHRLERSRYSMSCVVWYFGTRRRYTDVHQHTIVLGPRYRGLLNDIFDREVLAQDFSLYLHRSTAADPSLAPPGCDSFYALAPVPNLAADVDWRDKAEPYRASIERHLARTVLPGLEGQIATSHVTTPLDFQDNLLSFRGAAFGMAPIFKQSAYFRPHNRSEELDNLYFVGAGTHPGAGIPGVLSSAKVVDRLLPIAAYCKGNNEQRPGPARAASARVDLEACAGILVRGSRSFAAAARLMPRRLRAPSAAVYAFCRVADDAVDQAPRADLAVTSLARRLERIYRGCPDDSPADRAFCAVVHHFDIPRELPQALIDGFHWDAQNRRYDTLPELEEYCARVASTVGVMITLLMGRREPHVLARACDLGLAMQLTNICRDVGEDAAMGRLYLPRQWLAEADLDPEAFVRTPQFDERVAVVIRRVLATADRYYSRADAGISQLPRASRLAVRSARLIYAAIGDRIAANGYDSVSQRAHTSSARKALLILRAHFARFWRTRLDNAAPNPAVRFLVDAARDRDAG